MEGLSSLQKNEVCVQKDHLRRHGVPGSLRARYWQSVLQVQQLKDKLLQDHKATLDAEKFYAQAHGWGQEFVSSEVSSKVPGVEGEIFRDVPRTLPSRPLFREGRIHRMLARILKAVAYCFPDVGYCQGMNFVAAGIMIACLDSLNSNKPTSSDEDQEKNIKQLCEAESEIFWIMCGVLETTRMKELWRKGLPRIQLRVFQFGQLLKQHLPRLHGHFSSIGLTLDFFISQWFITLFAYQLPFNIVLPIWDVFFRDGWKIIFRVGLAIMHALQPAMIEMDMEDTTIFFRKQCKNQFTEATDLLVSAATFKITSSKVEHLQSEYFVQLVRSYLADAKDWQDMAPLPLQKKLKEQSNLSVGLARIRSELEGQDVLTVEDVGVMRQKIEKVEHTLEEATKQYEQTTYAFQTAKMQVDELLEQKQRLQDQLHDYLVCVSPRQTTETQPKSCPQQTICSDVNCFQEKILSVEKELTLLQNEFLKVDAAHVNATILFEDTVEQKNAFCEQLLGIVSANETHKLNQMKGWISDHKLEESFGE